MTQQIAISGKNGYVIFYGFAMDNSVRTHFIKNRNIEEVDEKIKELQEMGAYMICVVYTDEYHGFN